MTPTLHHDPYPGLHPGTGILDHGPHVWAPYSTPDDRTIHACQTCGALHPKDAAVEAATGKRATATLSALDEYDRTRDEAALLRALTPPDDEDVLEGLS